MKRPANLMIIPGRIYYFVNGLFLIFLVISCSREEPTPVTPDNYTGYTFEIPEVKGSTFYIDPANGSRQGDGSAENPWRTLQEVIEDELISYYRYSSEEDPETILKVVNEGAPVKGGDRLVLKSGYHGYVKRNVFIFQDWLTIEGEQGSQAILSQFRMEGAFARVYLNNVTIRKDSYSGDENYWEADAINRNSDACVYLRADDFWGDAGDIKLKDLTLMTTESAEEWTAADWVEKAAGGVNVRAVPRVEVINCRIQNVSMGMSFSDRANDGRAINNTIRNYCVDGARLISDDLYFAYNTITDCYKVDDNHDDAIQSYSIGEDGRVGTGVVSHVVLRGNIILGTTDFDNPLAGSPQGIGCFDGFFEDWIVENNVVIVDHYHGISFYGMRRGTIAHNTVIDQIPGNDISPWIMIHPHKDERLSENCTLINNIASRSVSAGGHIDQQANFVLRDHAIENLSGLFLDPDLFNYRLADNEFTRAHLIDQGSRQNGTESCLFDIEGNARDQYPDLGAYELQ